MCGSIHKVWCKADAVMLKYVGEYREYDKYCDAWQSAVTVIRSRDVTLKSCLEWLTSSYIISDGVGCRYTGGIEIKDDLADCNNDNSLVEPRWHRYSIQTTEILQSD